MVGGPSLGAESLEQLAQGFQLEKIYEASAEEWLAAATGGGDARRDVEALMEESASKRAETMRPSMGQDIFKGRRREGCRARHRDAGQPCHGGCR